MAIGSATPPSEWVSSNTTSQEIDEIVQFLVDQGTFNFPTLSTGLFSAAAAENPEFRLTGYQNVWVRDNIHIAHALWLIGEKQIAVNAIQSFVSFYSKYRHKFVDIISGKTDPANVQSRPHIRFDGESLTENDEHWAHAQNDAIGYFLWLMCKLLRSGDLSVSEEIVDLLSLVVQYLHKIEYWQDEESGHWEETKKIEASSIGPVVAGLVELKAWLSESGTELDSSVQDQIVKCLAQGESALDEILPAECIQPDPSQHRLYDSALLFLCYPLQIVDRETTTQITENVRQHLMEPIGIKRYIGDSYWCANYRALLSPETRTTDYSEDLSGRDALLEEGQEAQWCLFDPILSIIFAQRYLESGREADRELQLFHLKRSLAQLTDRHSHFGPYRCPESYFLEDGNWIPNDICPLLWTQANLRLALHWMKLSCQKS
ncbi:glycoside hydrolase family 15 protein [Thalassoglobus sp.]|uniref:glycoside hydrolase family 15 protein n=1 Tax=Thalassoglobus sp. TaxID=2795869 RepID=UPI003AA915D3